MRENFVLRSKDSLSFQKLSHHFNAKFSCILLSCALNFLCEEFLSQQKCATNGNVKISLYKLNSFSEFYACEGARQREPPKVKFFTSKFFDVFTFQVFKGAWLNWEVHQEISKIQINYFMKKNYLFAINEYIRTAKTGRTRKSNL